MLDLPDLNLRAKDRLEPHPLLMDVDLFDRVAQFPYRALFWRRSLETRCRHRNPLWDPEIGITLERLMVDKLHTLHMGPAMSYVCHVLWQLILVEIILLFTANQGAEAVRLLSQAETPAAAAGGR